MIQRLHFSVRGILLIRLRLYTWIYDENSKRLLLLICFLFKIYTCILTFWDTFRCLQLNIVYPRLVKSQSHFGQRMTFIGGLSITFLTLLNFKFCPLFMDCDTNFMNFTLQIIYPSSIIFVVSRPLYYIWILLFTKNHYYTFYPCSFLWNCLLL